MMLLVKAPPFKRGIHPMCKLASRSLHWSKRVRTGALSVASLLSMDIKVLTRRPLTSSPPTRTFKS